jgi:methylmalonyl-CoA mutase N-terminal domain/subunit
MGYDEAFELPSEEAVTLSLRTQQIIALETGVTRAADPLAGSFLVEHLTDEIETRARAVLREIEDLGGAVSALERGVPQRWITEAAYRAEQRLASGESPKVGVNVHVTGGDSREVELFQPDTGVEERQIERTRRRRAARDDSACRQALRRLEADTADGRNVMPALVGAAQAGATVGEMSDVFRCAFGEFREPSPW